MRLGKCIKNIENVILSKVFKKGLINRVKCLDYVRLGTVTRATVGCSVPGRDRGINKC